MGKKKDARFLAELDQLLTAGSKVADKLSEEGVDLGSVKDALRTGASLAGAWKREKEKVDAQVPSTDPRDGLDGPGTIPAIFSSFEADLRERYGDEYADRYMATLRSKMAVRSDD